MSGQPQTRLLCLKSEPLPLMPARHKHTHNHPHLSLPVSGQGRQWDNGRVDLGLSITAPVNASTCQRLDGANKPPHPMHTMLSLVQQYSAAGS